MVQNCVETTRNGKITWAYQLTSGDYVLAYNTTVLGQDVERASFLRSHRAADGGGETLTFQGAGTPVIYSNLRKIRWRCICTTPTWPRTFRWRARSW